MHWTQIPMVFCILQAIFHIFSTNSQGPNPWKVLKKGFDLWPSDIKFYLLFLGFFNFALKGTACWTFSIHCESAFWGILLHFWAKMCIFRDLLIENTFIGIGTWNLPQIITMGCSLSLYHNNFKRFKQRLEFVHFSVKNVEKHIFFVNSDL